MLRPQPTVSRWRLANAEHEPSAIAARVRSATRTPATLAAAVPGTDARGAVILAGMATSLATQLLHGDHEVGCPRCGYPIWIMYAEIVAQTAVRCPCCRIGIWLHDADGSTQN